MTFQLANTGNSHFFPDRVRRARLHGQRRHPVADWPVNGWYVLAGGRATFALSLDAPACGRVRQPLVEVKVGETVLKSAAHDTWRRVPA